ncbi:MAG: hypothetical protein WB787_06275, partial [Candidatus Acidiferrales bacterium]
MNSKPGKSITLGKWILFLMVVLIVPGITHAQNPNDKTKPAPPKASVPVQKPAPPTKPATPQSNPPADQTQKPGSPPAHHNPAPVTKPITSSLPPQHNVLPPVKGGHGDDNGRGNRNGNTGGRENGTPVGGTHEVRRDGSTVDRNKSGRITS